MAQKPIQTNKTCNENTMSVTAGLEETLRWKPMIDTLRPMIKGAAHTEFSQRLNLNMIVYTETGKHDAYLKWKYNITKYQHVHQTGLGNKNHHQQSDSTAQYTRLHMQMLHYFSSLKFFIYRRKSHTHQVEKYYRVDKEIRIIILEKIL